MRHFARCRRRSTVVLMLCLGMVFAGTARPIEAQSKVQPGDAPAILSAKVVRFFFPLPFHRVKPSSPPTPGYFAWRVSVDGVAGAHFAFGPEGVMKSYDPPTIAKASTLRRCPITQDSALVSALNTCRERIEGTVFVGSGAIVVEIRDTAVIADLRRLRPQTFTRYVFEPGGRYRMERMRFLNAHK